MPLILIGQVYDGFRPRLKAREYDPMSIRLIARDLYRLIGEVEQLKQKIVETPDEKQADLKEQLRKLKAERNRMKGVLEGCKDRN